MSLQSGYPGALIVGADSSASGACGPRGLARLAGMRVPAVELPWALEAKTSLAELARHRSLVAFFYPGAETRMSGDEEADVDTVRAWAWREHESELAARGYMVLGVSTQTPETQARWAAFELLDYMLLSDGDLQIANVLRLPTVLIAGKRAYEPLTMVVRDGRIARVFHPIDPACDAASVTDWVRKAHEDEQKK
jgi:thioredoxin-dependent peroxiredoxin